MKSNFKTIIGFAGRKRSGKTMLCKEIKKNVDNVVIVTIADSLKFLCCELLGVDYNHLLSIKDDGTTFDREVDERWIQIIQKATNIPSILIKDEIGGKHFTSVREMLQIIGTDLIRKYNPNWHIDETVRRINAIDDDKIVLIDDVRFPNEKETIETLLGKVYFVIRPNNFDVSNHPSETALSFTDFIPQNVIINDLPKHEIVNQFISYYFNGKNMNKSTIFLRKNYWYVNNMINLNADYEKSKINHIIESVISQNIKSPAFINNGIITFDSPNKEDVKLFRNVIMNEEYVNEKKTAYSIYNPLTNEILKKFF